MLGTYVEALTMGVLLAALMFGAGWAVGAVGIRMVEDPARVQAIRDIITRRARLENAFEARREKRETQLGALEGELAGHMRRKHQLQQRLNLLKSSQDVWVRVLGEESKGLNRFVAQLSNRYVTPAAQKEGKHTLIDVSWSVPQRIEIWASAIGEARSLVEKRFPPSFGFVMHSIVASDTDGMKAE